ncbi:MAG TPA: O-methyltransferase [Mycobacteriales bacterium]|jgi:predicted O-methyltransferase YrrM|nr:O-methyltransferase [Mycobacteriales bacterium]
MDTEQWDAVDDYLIATVLPPDPVLASALSASAAAGLPNIQVAPNQGRLLQLLAQIQGARRILEVGTLGGYSTIWLARALPAGGHLDSLEIDPKHAEVARASLAAAGFADSVEVHVGPALDTLPTLAKGEPYDFVFIDADKPSNPDYLSWALRLTRPGSVIVVDNVVRAGAVADQRSEDAGVRGTQQVLAMLGAEPRLRATAVQTVGGKGYDGFALAVVMADGS